MYMSENIGLYQFWLDAEFSDSVYYLPEAEAYVIAGVEEMVLGYTPVRKESYMVREHKKEDCTLFILGEDLKRIEENRMIFPIVSHA